MKSLNLVIFLFYILSNINCQLNNSSIKTAEKNIKSEGPSFLFDSNPIFKKFEDDWSQYMTNFLSQYLYTIPLPYKTEVEYYENITRAPCLLQGALIFEEAKSEKEKIDFKIIAPNRKVIFQSSDIASIFSIQLYDKGLYTFQFNNKAINKVIRPTFMVNSGQNLILEKENLSGTEDKLDKIVAFLQKYDQDRKLTRGFVRRGNEELKKTNKYFYAFSFIETIVLVAVSIWQYFYLKHLFEIKGSL